jgi:radical SAM-linked protein
VLSQSKISGKLDEKKRVLALPELVPPRNIRLKFVKYGTLQYISHLDLQRTFNRIINRACLPVWYTKGFNPHIKMVFSTRLSVGSESICEYLDIRIDREMPCEEIMERLNAEMTEEFHITDAYVPDSDFSEIKWASYKISITTAGVGNELAEKIQQTLTTSPLNLIKRTKAGEKEIDIIPLIYSVDTKYDAEKGAIEIDATVSASTTEYLNPELLITGLKNTLGILSTDPTEEYYSIMRTDLLKEDMTRFS